jgi:hypothetical protein
MHAFVPARNHAHAAVRGHAAHAPAEKTTEPDLESPELTLLPRFAYDLSRISILPATRVVVEGYPGADPKQKRKPPEPAPEKAGDAASEKSSAEPEDANAPADRKPVQTMTVRAEPPKAAISRQEAAPARASVRSTAPKPLSWSAIQALPRERAAFVTGPPASNTLAGVWAGGHKGDAGITTLPVDYKAPDYDFLKPIRRNTRRASFVGKDIFWRPRKKTAAFEGTGVSKFTAPGKYPTGDKENGKDVFWNFSPATSDLVRTGEQEHCDDVAEAYRISLKEADDVLNAQIYGKDFGPRPTVQEAEKLVRDTIAAKLTHPQLGGDQTQWGTKFYNLYLKTKTRDDSGWHTISTGTRTEDPAGITYEIVKGNSQIPGPASNTIIKY